MTEYDVNISIEDEFRGVLAEDWLRSIVLEVLETEDVEPPVETGLVISNNETVQYLNQTYRNKNEPTDVLSFPMLYQSSQQDISSFIAPPDGIRHLGEVIISYPKAVQQAEDQEHEIKHELILLIVHGVLHLLGYDHERLEEEQQMRAKERHVIEKIAIHRAEK